MKHFVSEFHTDSLSDRVRIGLMSDLHFGSSSLIKKALKADFEYMVENNCTIGINGDVFDLVLPSDLKRFDLDALDRAMIQQGVKPIDAAIEIAYEFIKPYAHKIKFIGIGNHEAHVYKRHHVDVLSILLYRLNQLPNVKIENGGWCGYWNIRLIRDTKRSNYLIYRHHGAGGAAPMTKGMIDFQRMMIWQGDVDAIWIGHKHNRISDPGATKVVYDNRTNTHKTKKVTCVMTGSYLSTYGEGEAAPSYAMGWNLSPQMSGGAILELKMTEEQVEYKKSLRIDSRLIQ